MRQIERYASQNFFLLGGKKVAMSWMNGDFWLAYNDGAWKQDNWGIVNVMCNVCDCGNFEVYSGMNREPVQSADY